MLPSLITAMSKPVADRTEPFDRERLGIVVVVSF
jgi:hypothetical protein